jgi:hypothetical protein
VVAPALSIAMLAGRLSHRKLAPPEHGGRHCKYLQGSAISSFRLRGAASNSQVGRANAPFDSHQPACCDRAYFSSIQIDVDGFDGEWRYSIRPGRNDDPISEQDLG